MIYYSNKVIVSWDNRIDSKMNIFLPVPSLCYLVFLLFVITQNLYQRIGLKYLMFAFTLYLY